jgi:hypothetical protein
VEDPSPYEGALVPLHKVIQVRGKPRGEHLGEQLAETVDKTYGPEILDLLFLWLLLEQDH